MPNPYGTIITDAGAALIAAAMLNGGKLPVAWAAVGDRNGERGTPSRDQTDLVHECWRGEIASAELNAVTRNMIDVKIVIPDDVGNFTIRELGLFSTEGVLIAVGSTPDTEKAAISQGVSGRLTLTIHLLVADASVLEFVINPSLDMVSREELDEALLDQRVEIMGEVGGILSSAASAEELDLTIPAEGWAEGPADLEDPPGLYIDVPDDRVRAELVPFLALLPASLSAARDCGLSTAARTLDGALRLYAQRVPTADMAASLTLLRTSGGTFSGGGGSGAYTLPPATAERLGGVKIGPGVHVDPDGTISVDGASIVEAVAASDEEAERMLEGVFGPEEAAP